jgi:hypothetical protein
VIPELPELNSGFASCYPKFPNKIRVSGISGSSSGISGSGFGLRVFCPALMPSTVTTTPTQHPRPCLGWARAHAHALESSLGSLPRQKHGIQGSDMRTRAIPQVMPLQGSDASPLTTTTTHQPLYSWASSLRL